MKLQRFGSLVLTRLQHAVLVPRAIYMTTVSDTHDGVSSITHMPIHSVHG